MILAYLILAHMLGDFILQPTKLVIWKMNSKWGTLTHVLVHFIVSLIVLFPFILNGHYLLISLAAFINFVHFWIDEGKINYDLKHDEKVRPFLLDQLMHLITILFAYSMVYSTNFTLPNTAFNNYYTDLTLINFVTLAIFTTTVLDIYHFQKKREKNPKTKFKFNTLEMLKRLGVLAVVYGLFVLIQIFVTSNLIT